MDKWIMDDKELRWWKMFGLLNEYYKEYGNFKIRATFKTSDGITEDPNGVNLGMWLAKQKERCNPESEHGQLLSSIGVPLGKIKVSKKRVPWEEMFKLAKKYFDEYHSKVKYSFKTNDGITYDENGLRLGEWFYRQEKKWDPDSGYGKLLSSIGAEFRSNSIADKDVEWMKMYLVAAKYYQDNGNLNVSKTFKTEDGIELGKWLDNQRDYYRINRLSEEKIFLLNSIGMIWEKRKNNFAVVLMCEENNIDIVKNHDSLKNKSIIEIRVKLAYLKDRGISFVGIDGIVHEIFSMSSMNMKLKYNVSLEDLINMYNKEKSK